MVDGVWFDCLVWLSVCFGVWMVCFGGVLVACWLCYYLTPICSLIDCGCCGALVWCFCFLVCFSVLLGLRIL